MFRNAIIACVAIGAFTTTASAQDDLLVQSERARLTRHLSQVEADLREADVAHLSDELRAAREANLDALHAYIERGEFPRNTRHEEDYLPYFIDDYGTACAVGYLVIESGHADLADRVAYEQNNEYLLEMTVDGLGPWVEASGLSAEELARIQPSYCGPDFDAEPCGGGDAGTGGEDDGGCSVGGASGRGLAWPALALLGVAAFRRRR